MILLRRVRIRIRILVLAAGLALAASATAVSPAAASAAPPAPVPAAPPSPAPGKATVVDSVSRHAAHERIATDRQGRVLLYLLGDNEAALRTAAGRAGGQVTAAQPGRVRAAIPEDRIGRLAGQPGVRQVTRPTRVLPSSVTSEGVPASGADAWVQAGLTGTGVKVGILDVGFAGLAESQAAGELPNVTLDVSSCPDGGTASDHGVQTAEVVHDMAPGAQLFLSCAEDDMGFGPAADWLGQQDVRVIVAAVSIPGAGRGDGTGTGADSPAEVVKRSRQDGVFWAAAAGNYGLTHFAGDAADRGPADGWAEFSGTSEVNGFTLRPGGTATATLRWDAWPTTTSDLDLFVTDTPALPTTDPNDPHVVARSTLSQRTTPGGGIPLEEIQFRNDTGAALNYYLSVRNNNAPFTTPFELFLTSPGTNQLQWFTPAGSITEPASSPYATAVGATSPGSGQLESYSSRGPTTDGRAKPDITGYDQVSTFGYGPAGFAGTSAAAAHAGGAAALLLGANPQLDPAQLQDLLERRAVPVPNASRNDWGAGRLTLGPPGTPTVTATGYTPLTSPTTVLDTRTTTGGHQGPLHAGEAFALALPGVPANTTAVALTLTASTTAATHLQVFADNPGATAATPTDWPVQAARQTTLTVVTPVGADRAVRLRNLSGDLTVWGSLVGYFSPDGAGAYTPITGGTRILDTQDRTSTHPAPLGAGEEVAVQVRGANGVPATATAVAVNLTVAQASTPTFVAAYPQTYTTAADSVFLNVAQRRTNLALVRIGDDGRIRVRSTAGLTHLAVDLLGWFAPGVGARFVPSFGVDPVLDTVTGNGTPSALTRGQDTRAQLPGVPAEATAVLLTGMVDDQGHATGVSLSAAETGWTVAPQAAVDLGRSQPVSALVGLGTSATLTVRNEDGRADISLGVAGYFVGGTPAGPAGNCVTPGDEPGFLSLLDGRPDHPLGRWNAAGGTIAATQNGCELTAAGTGSVLWNPADIFDNNYTLRVDWKTAGANPNGSVDIGLSRAGATPPAVHVAIGGSSAAPTDRPGAIKGIKAPSTAAENPAGQWNTFEITVAGARVVVRLNGVQVNDYTSPTAFVGRSMLAVTGGGGDPITYRNLRVRDDRRIGSGALRGPGGLCLGSGPQLAACTGAPAQTWDSYDSVLSLLGSCLDTSGGATAAGTAVVLAACSGEVSQDWQPIADGRVLNVKSGRCLAANGTAGSTPTLQDCTGQPQQLWSVTDRAADAGRIENDGNAGCLNVTNRVVADGAALGTPKPCPQSFSSIWVFGSDGTVHALSRCLAVKNNATADGSPVVTANCGTAPGEQWRRGPNNSLVNPASGRCLDASSGVTIRACNGSLVQAWRVNRTFANRGPVVGVLGKCVDVTDNVDANGTAIQLWPCNGTPAQQVLLSTDGAIHMRSRCLDLTNGGTATGTPVQLHDCNGTSAQRWYRRPDGLVQNPGSGRCLGTSGGSDANGTRLVLADCAYIANQMWGFELD